MNYPFKVASIRTVSLNNILDFFKDSIVEINAKAKIDLKKPFRYEDEDLGAIFYSNNYSSLSLNYDIRKHKPLDWDNREKLKNKMKEFGIEDAAVQKLTIRIKDNKLGKIYREILADVDEFIDKPEMPLIKRIPGNDYFYFTFFSDSCEDDPELKETIYKSKDFKFFILNLKKSINEWQRKNLPERRIKFSSLPLRLNLINIEDWNWKANFLPDSYLSSSLIIDYLKANYLKEYGCSKTYGQTSDNKIILSKFEV